MALMNAKAKTRTSKPISSSSLGEHATKDCQSAFSSRADQNLTFNIRCHCRRLVLDESFQPDNDIRVFLQSKFPKTIVKRSSGQFIYAATLVKFVGERGHRPTERLKVILDMSPPAKASGAFAELDCLYSQILSFSADIALTLRLPCGISFLEGLPPLQNDSAGMFIWL